jgi:hypothetical protein
MHIQCGRFTLDKGHGLFIRVPGLGQLHWPRLGLYADTYRTLRAAGEVR